MYSKAGKEGKELKTKKNSQRKKEINKVTGPTALWYACEIKSNSNCLSQPIYHARHFK